tara:strand:+ start:5640 stop:5975 length:336 start_codon:yes stop_codon:yes gene_type:complete
MTEFGENFLDWSVNIALVAMFISFALTVFRLLRGPTFADRVVALDMLALLGIAFIGVIAVVTKEYAYLDVAIALALVGFLATVAFARYIFRSAQKESPKGDASDSAEGDVT